MTAGQAMEMQEARRHAQDGTVLRDATGARWVVAAWTATHLTLEQPGTGRTATVPLTCDLRPEE